MHLNFPEFITELLARGFEGENKANDALNRSRETANRYRSNVQNSEAIGDIFLMHSNRNA